MLARLGLPAPQLSTKLYGTIALFLMVVYALATATIQFAGQTEEATTRFRREGIGNVELSTRLQVLLEQHRRLVAQEQFAAESAGAEPGDRAFRELNGRIAGLIDRLAPDQADKLSQRFALVAAQSASVVDLARAGESEQATAGAVRYAAAADSLMLEVLSEGQRQVQGVEGDLERLSAQARSFTTWVSVAAAVTGLLIGPLGLLLLRRVLARLEGIGSALIRLARNDTSVDIPGVAEQDEFGQLARSVSVFKTKSIELLNKKADFERLNLQLDAAINNMPLGLSMFDAQERLLVCNKRYAEMYEVPSELTRPGTVHCALWQHRTRKGARHSETRETAIDGRASSPSMLIEFGSGRIVSVSRQPLRGGGWVSLHEDITERRRQEEAITHLARHDALTGLANRVLFREQLEQSLQRLVRGQGFAVLCLDLDHFKAVNDTLGHPIGDALLKQVSQRLLGCVRHGDLVARLGGDEFAIIQASVRDPNQTESLAQRIVATVSAPYEIDGHRIEIGASVGITLAPRDGTEADELIKNADLALYRTKAAGRRGYSFFKAEMTDEIQSRRSLEVDLRKALHEEGLELAYQPQMRLATDQIAGFEALLWWHHPERGLVPPDEVTAIAEDMGLIGEVGEWTLARACAEAVRWPNPVSVAVNVSGLQFVKRTLVESVLQALAQSGLQPDRLVLEVTEAVLLQGGQHTLAMLHQLRQLGVRIAMDEFGTGHCSLSNLRAFTFDKIKIGKALIADCDRNEDTRAIVQAVIALGTSLGMTTAAEGVENREQLDMVRGWGCAEAQGYLLSPPVASADVEGVLVQGCTWARSAA